MDWLKSKICLNPGLGDMISAAHVISVVVYNIFLPFEIAEPIWIYI